MKGCIKMDYQEIIMQLIVSGGNARSYAMEAIRNAKYGNIEAAKKFLLKADDELCNAHKIQTQLIQKEAAGSKIEITLLMVHAQDHLMNAITVKDIAAELVDIYEKNK